jgi:RsiW-degrading membrane proteinase PrsW (M82 family)
MLLGMGFAYFLVYFLYRAGTVLNQDFTVFWFKIFSLNIQVHPFIKNFESFYSGNALDKTKISATQEIVFTIIPAIIEEVGKFAIFAWYIRRRDRIQSVKHGIVAIGAVALGFAYLESIFYILNWTQNKWTENLLSGTVVRGVFLACAHILFSSFLAYFVIRSRFHGFNLIDDGGIRKYQKIKRLLAYFGLRISKVSQVYVAYLYLQWFALSFGTHIAYNASLRIYDQPQIALLIVGMGIMYIFHLMDKDKYTSTTHYTTDEKLNSLKKIRAMKESLNKSQLLPGGASEVGRKMAIAKIKTKIAITDPHLIEAYHTPKNTEAIIDPLLDNQLDNQLLYKQQLALIESTKAANERALMSYRKSTSLAVSQVEFPNMHPLTDEYIHDFSQFTIDRISLRPREEDPAMNMDTIARIQRFEVLFTRYCFSVLVSKGHSGVRFHEIFARMGGLFQTPHSCLGGRSIRQYLFQEWANRYTIHDILAGVYRMDFAWDGIEKLDVFV